METAIGCAQPSEERHINFSAHQLKGEHLRALAHGFHDEQEALLVKEQRLRRVRQSQGSPQLECIILSHNPVLWHPELAIELHHRLCLLQYHRPFAASSSLTS